MNNKNELWPRLPWNDWRESAMTVHLFTQIIGKIRLALMPMQAEWGQVPFTVTSRGPVAVRMPIESGSVDIAFDFISHTLNVYPSNGKIFSFSLKDISVGAFYREVMKILAGLEIKVKINPMSVEMPVPVKMDTDEEHKTYDADAVRRWWHLLIMISNVFNKFRSGFSGKETPVNFFWGSFDLTISMFSGKFVPPKPEFDLLYRVAMDAEQITIGFWPGDDPSPEPVFFAYTYPNPDGFEDQILKPAEAKWSSEKGEFLLPYEFVRRQDDPERTLLEFCESIFQTGAKLAGWDKTLLEHKPPVERVKAKK